MEKTDMILTLCMAILVTELLMARIITKHIDEVKANAAAACETSIDS